MIDCQTFLQMRRLRNQEHLSIVQIARALRVDERTVTKWIKRPRYQPRAASQRKSKLDRYRGTILRLLAQRPYKAQQLLERLRQDGYRGGYSILKQQVRTAKRLLEVDELLPSRVNDEPREWMRLVLQGALHETQVRKDVSQCLPSESIRSLLDHILTKPLKLRNRALTLLAHAKGVSIRDTAAFLCVSCGTVRKYVRAFANGGVQRALDLSRKAVKKADESKYSDAVFQMIHTPPIVCGFNRTTWRMVDLKLALARSGLRISKDGIRNIIKKAGFKFRKAKKVLTSTDPEYKEKLERITGILGNLKSDEKFFSIDEFGPFALKIQGGRALAKAGEIRTVPQYQKSKGTLIVTAALELSTNQVAHFYSAKKNTDEMLRMLDLLLERYRTERRIYFSWDAASWHASKRFIKRVNEVNASEYRTQHENPEVALAPLPACAQFLNVIESVFSGMARAIIHNSDYQSVEECKVAIDRHFAERNDHFQKHPQRAGKKIWGKERVVPEFNLSNNCKDPRW